MNSGFPEIAGFQLGASLSDSSRRLPTSFPSPKAVHRNTPTMLSFSAASRRHFPTVAVSSVTIDQKQVLAFHQAQSLVTPTLQRTALFILHFLFACFSSALHMLQLLWRATEPYRDRYAEQFVRNLMSPTAVFIFVFWPGWLVVGAVGLVWKVLG